MSLRHLVGVTALSLMIGTVAEAAPIPLSYDIPFDPEPDILFDNVSPGACQGNVATGVVTGQTNGACATLTYTYVLPGFVPATDTLFSGSLTLTFFDDAEDPGRFGKPETVDISLDGVLTPGIDIPSSPFSTGPFDVRAALAADGMLTVVLALSSDSEGNNDFFFESSRLIARGERNEPSTIPTPSPEPASIALFGLMLTAIGYRLRR